MSFCTSAMEAARIAVNAPTTATIVRGLRRQLEQRVRARHHVDARRHHGGGVDQGGNRRGAFHGVRQPDVQRELRRLARGADEQQQRHRAQHAEARGLGGEPAARAAPGSRPGSAPMPNTANISNMPRMKPASPMRFTMNAFLPASPADFLWK